MNERTHNLKEGILEAKSRWITERGKLITEAYKKYESESVPVKRALALAHILDNKTIYIQDGELLVGNYAAEHGCYELYPEYSFQDSVTRYIHFDFERELDNSDFEHEHEKQDFREMASFWKGRNMREISDTNIPDYIQKCRDYEICGNPYGRDEGQGHVAVEYDRVINEGMRAFIEKAKMRLTEVIADDPKAYDFLRGVIITSEALIRFSNRYADEAERLATSESNPERKRELDKIAYNCRRVPEHPAENFWQACQVTAFIQMILHIEQNGFSISLGRFDQYAYPLFKKDIDDGRLTDDGALELIENLYIKCMEITIGGIRISLTQTVTICGKDQQGNDLTNDLSMLCIKADRETKMVQPSTMIRWHKNINKKVIEEVIDATYTGDASIAFINDDVIIPALIKWGVKEEDAHEYAQCGCNETEIPGKMIGGGLPRPIFMLRVLDVVLNGGIWPETGEMIGVKTKTLGEYETFDEVMDAYKAQYEFFMRYVFIAANIMDNLHANYAPLPFASSLMNGTVERGRDIMEETDYFFYAIGCNDIIATTNSLTAMKKTIFEDKSVSQKELKKALAANWEGYEDVRKKMLTAPKFGNDDNYVDDMMQKISNMAFNSLKPYRSIRNNAPSFLECIPRISHVYEGLLTKATPDGRKSGDTLSPGISAHIGTDREGPTALLNSMSKTNAELFTGAVINNIRFHPNVLRGNGSKDKTVDLLNTYFKKGGIHLQMNCVNKETLLDAQKNPQNYRDLMVRVSGYVDYFTNMDEASQNDIIKRTIHDS